MVCVRGYKMNSWACLFDPKNILMCVVLVWLFANGCFCEQIFKFFLQFAILSTFFHFANLSRFGNRCFMEHLQGFEGLVQGWGLAFNNKSRQPQSRASARRTNFLKPNSRCHENALAFVVPSCTCKTNQTKGKNISGVLAILCHDQC